MKINRKTLTGLGITLAVLVVIIVNMFIQMNIAGNYPLEEATKKAVKGLVARGGLVSCILAAGIALYFLIILQQVMKKNDRVEEIVQKLVKKDFSPAAEDTEDDPQLRELRKSINSLGVWFTHLRGLSISAEQLKTLYAADIQERNSELDNIHTTINAMMDNFSSLEKNIAGASEELGMIETVIASYHDKTNEQSSFMEHAGKNISESASLINDLSKKIDESTALSKELEKEITEGEEQVHGSHEIIKIISVDLEKIHEITQVINQISEQTNILSMNAAIESAHAGSAGAGFAVVADEIRKLAESTRENAEQISREVNALTEKIREALKASEDSSMSFNEITGKIRNFSQEIFTINSIASRSLEKTEGIHDAIRKTAEISQLVRERTAEMTVGNQHFHEEIHNMKDLVDKTRSKIMEIQTGTRETFEKTFNIEKEALNAIDGLVQLKKSMDNPDPLKPVSRISAAAGEVKNQEKPKSEIYTLKKPTEAEKKETRETIETVLLPERKEPPKTAGTSGEEEIYYDERGVAVKRPPTTIL